jgi:hypothetical protein
MRTVERRSSERERYLVTVPNDDRLARPIESDDDCPDDDPEFDDAA